MEFNGIPPRSTVFIDANIFIYHFTGTSEECSSFLRKCETGELKGITATNVLAEVLHRLMMIEAVQKGLVTPGNVAAKLKGRPDIVKALSQSYVNTLRIPEMGIEVWPLTVDAIRESQKARSRIGFMPNDSFIMAIMEEAGVKNLVTHDRDFKRVKAIKTFFPHDVG